MYNHPATPRHYDANIGKSNSDICIWCQQRIVWNAITESWEHLAFRIPGEMNITISVIQWTDDIDKRSYWRITSQSKRSESDVVITIMADYPLRVNGSDSGMSQETALAAHYAKMWAAS